MRVTIKDIAKKTGYSVSTVSIALNKKEFRLPQKTRDEILKTAKEMGYVRNQTAISLRKKRSNTIGLIIPDIRNDFYATFAKGCEQTCSENGWGLIITNSDNHQEKESRYIDMLYQKNVAGIIMARASLYNEKPIDTFGQLKKLKIPHVLLDFSGTSVSNVVSSDHELGGYLVTKHLLKLGHRKIACITGDLSLEGAKSRLNGYQKALQEAGIAYDKRLIYESDYTFETTREVVKKMDLGGFTAVFAFNDLMALAFENYVRENGYQVPRDFSVAGYDNTAISKIMYPSLTTVDQSVQKMGASASNILMDPDVENGRVIKEFTPHLILRESTAQVKN